MKTKIYYVTFFFLTLLVLKAQAQKEETLFTIDGNPVSVAEFQRVYEKNLSILNDANQKDITNYLNLYINYKLKLREAFDLKMDTLPSYKKEFDKYKNQLIAPYLKDPNTERDLVKEAYNHLQKEVHAGHILVRLDKNATPQDTLAAYHKILKARERILKGESFDKVAKEMSEDPSAQKNGGDLGYFTAFQMVYPFEIAAYNTPVGQVSQPFKTRFGYHIVKVFDVRDARGAVEVAHIMLKGVTPQNKAKIQTIKDQLDKGANFEDLAKQYSQDGGSSKKGGLLPKFSSGRMVKEFEDVAFALKKEGAISKPFKTAYGWHIAKLIKKYPIKSFKEMEPELSKKVAQGNRAKIIGNSIERRLLKEYSIQVNPVLLKAFKNPDWKNITDLKGSLAFLRIQDKVFTAGDFYNFYLGHRSMPLGKALTLFEGKEAIKYYKAHLSDHFPELAYTLQEYKEGLLLFDLMQQKVWEKAEKDTTGLKKFFADHKDKYQWKKRVKALFVTCHSLENAQKAYQLLKNKTDVKSIENQFPKTSLVAVKEGLFEINSDVFPKNFAYKKGVTQPIKKGEQYQVIAVEKIIAPQGKLLKEVKGKVISDYQDFIEKQWINQLKNKYTVTTNTANLNKLINSYKD